jgi:hypothetical protein
MADVDGRLDLDELGRVIEEASGLGATPSVAPTDLDVLEGADGPPLSERVGSWRVSVWLRRHRVLVAAVVTVAVAITATISTVQARRAPDDDGRLHLSVADYLPGGGDGFDMSDPTGAVMTAAYNIVPDRPGDTDELVAITGPGIRASSAHAQDPSPVGDKPPWTVAAILGCDDPSAWTASLDKYRLVARRTDGFGRTVQESVPLPIGTELTWDQQVRYACLQSQVQTRMSLESASAVLTRDFQSMVVTLRVRSSLDHDIVVTPSGGPGESVRGHGPATTIPAGSSRELVVPFTFEDCAAPTMETVPVSPPGSPDPVYMSERGVNFNVTAPFDDLISATWSLLWSDEMATSVHHLVETACRGVPDATVHTAGVRLAADSDVQFVRSLYGDTDGTALRVRFDVATTSPAVQITDVVSRADMQIGSAPTILTGTGTGTGRTRSGHARVEVQWNTTCGAGASPPVLQLHLTRGDRRYAVLVTVADSGLTRGLLESCPDLALDQLTDNGWPAVPDLVPQPAP